MEALQRKSFRIPGDYEGAVAASSEQAEKAEWYDANPGGTNTMMQLDRLRWNLLRNYDELGDAPAAVALPVSNGTTFAGVCRGFSSLNRRGKTSRMPRMVAAHRLERIRSSRPP